MSLLESREQSYTKAIHNDDDDDDDDDDDWFKQNLFIHRNYNFNKQVQETQKAICLSVTYRLNDNYVIIHLRWQDGKLLSKVEMMTIDISIIGTGYNTTIFTLSLYKLQAQYTL